MGQNLSSTVIVSLIIIISCFLFSALTAHADITDRLIAYYPADENSNKNLTDFFGNYDFTSNNSPQSVIGILNSARFMNDSKSQFFMRDNAFIANIFDGNSTLCAWYYFYSNSEYTFMFMTGDNTGNNKFMSLRINEITFYNSFNFIDDSLSQNAALNTDIPPLKSWTYICGMKKLYNSTHANYSIFWNGTLKNSILYVNVSPVQTSIAGINGYFDLYTNWGGQTYSGKFVIDELGIWNRSLTDIEINTLYTNYLNGTSPIILLIQNDINIKIISPKNNSEMHTDNIIFNLESNTKKFNYSALEIYNNGDFYTELKQNINGNQSLELINSPNGNYTVYAVISSDTLLNYSENITFTNNYVNDYNAWISINELSQSQSIMLGVLIFGCLGVLSLGLFFKNPAFRVLGCIIGIFVGVYVLQVNYMLGIMVMLGNVIGMCIAAIK